MPARRSLAVGLVRCFCKLNRCTVFDQSRSAVSPGWSSRLFTTAVRMAVKAKVMYFMICVSVVL